MIELAKRIHTLQENDEDVVIEGQHITADRSMRLYGEITFKNCDVEIAPHSAPRFVIESEASVTFENCRFTGEIFDRSRDRGTHPPVITAPEDSTLTFTGCRMENPDDFIRSEGAVELRGCEIRYSGGTASADSTAPAGSSSPSGTVLLSPFSILQIPFAVRKPFGVPVCEFLRADGEDVELTDCTVDCGDNDAFSVIFPMEHGRLRNCRLKGVLQLEADALENCTLENCVTVSLQTEDGNNEATDCRFLNCREIICNYAGLTGCEIIGLRDNFAFENSSATRCTFRDMTPGTDGIIDLDESDMTGCTFENITLKDDRYLFDSDNESSLDGCTFKNCRTTREDLQLVSTGGYKGRLLKQWVEDDICSGCTGLEKVIHIESWEE